MTRYGILATLLASRIEQGLYCAGEKLPSVRTLSREHGVSISTVQQAWQVLEQRQLIVSRPRSGYYVAPRSAVPPLPAMTRPVQQPLDITQWDEVMSLLGNEDEPGLIRFGGGSPDISHPTLKPLWREISRVVQHQAQDVMRYDQLAGRRELRQQIARLLLDGETVADIEDIIITSGCHSGLSLALQAICKPGDIVAVESPCYYGTLQLLRSFGIRTIEIPTDAESGISVEALELALEQWPIKGVLLVANCNNPLGFIMSASRKRALLALAQRHDVVIFEDDIYGELAFDYPRPCTLKSLDSDGRVVLCSSFTKTLAPGLRIGWILPGRYRDRILHLKYAISGTNVAATQLAVANFIRDGHYHRHVRRMRQHYQRQLETYTCLVRQHFPTGICVTRPRGGFMLWVELPEQVDMVRVAQQLKQQNIRLATGPLFSAAGKYRNCLRINCALTLIEQHRAALALVGDAVSQAFTAG